MRAARSSTRFVALASPERSFVCRILRGDSASWPANGDVTEQRFLDLCADDGVAALVHYRARRTPEWSGWPAGVRACLDRDAAMQAAADMLGEGMLIEALGALAEAGVAVLVLKGAALAYTHYAQPSLRTRCDADLLIRPGDRERARGALQRQGYRCPNSVTGKLVSYQELHVRALRGIDHVIDLHWQVNNAQVFAQALGYAEAQARSVPIAPLGPSARALYPPHALLLACMHRAAHLGADGPSGNRLIWLHDIDLISRAMTDDEWREFAALCSGRAMRATALDAFAHAQDAFATVIPSAVADVLGQPTREISAAYLARSRGPVRIADLAALSTWGERATLLCESAFPPADYMLEKYASQRRWLLPWWYVRRAAEGVRKWSKR